MTVLTREERGIPFECPDCSTKVRPDEPRFTGEAIVSAGPGGDRVVPIHFCQTCGTVRVADQEQARLRKAGAPGFTRAADLGERTGASPAPPPPPAPRSGADKSGGPRGEPAGGPDDGGLPPGVEEAGQVRLILGRSYGHVTLRNEYGRVEVHLGSYAREGEADDALLGRVRETTRRHFLDEIDRAEGRRA